MSEGRYREIKLLGEGAFGKCFLCECISDKSLVAIKQIDLRSQSEQERKEALKESKILEAFDHPNIIKFREVYKTTSGKLCIVMDFADGGDLAGQIKNQKGRYFTEAQVLDWFVQICLAMKHVHDRKVLHRDIKSQNVFLTKAGTIKLGDFGIARVLNNTRDIAKTMVGTPYYLSPELVQNKPYSFKSDVWSLGVLLYELCTLKPPFDATSLHNLALKIVRGAYPPIPPQFSKDMKTLVAQMLHTDSNKRPTVNQVLRSSIISGRIRNCLSESKREEEFKHTVLHHQNLFGGKKVEVAAPGLVRKPPPGEGVRNLPPARDGGRKEPVLKEAQKRPPFEAAIQPNPGKEEIPERPKNYHYQKPREEQRPREEQKPLYTPPIVEKPPSQPESKPRKSEPNWEPQYAPIQKIPAYDAERYREAVAYKDQRFQPEAMRPIQAKIDLPPARYDPPKPVQKPVPNLYVPPEERPGYLPPQAKAPDRNVRKQHEEQKRRQIDLEEAKQRRKEAAEVEKKERNLKRQEERKQMLEDIRRKARKPKAGIEIEVVGGEPESLGRDRPIERPKRVEETPFVLPQTEEKPEETRAEEIPEGLPEELEDREDLSDQENSYEFAHASDEDSGVLIEEVKSSPPEAIPPVSEDRNWMLSDIRRRKKELRDSKRRGEVMIEWAEEKAVEERQAVLYEMQEFLLADDAEEAPALVPANTQEEEDREDDIIEATTMIPAAPGPPEALPLVEELGEDHSKFNTLESLRDYLETKLGVDVVVAAHQVVSEVGMSGNDDEDIPVIYERLRNVMSLQTLQRYLFFFQTMAIIEKTAYV